MADGPVDTVPGTTATTFEIVPNNSAFGSFTYGFISANDAIIEVFNIDDVDANVLDEFLNGDIEFFHAYSLVDSSILHSGGRGGAFAWIGCHHVSRNFHQFEIAT